MPQPPPPPTLGRTGLSRAEWTGLLLMLAATTMLGLFPSGARLAYDGGGSPETLSVLRHIASFSFVGLFLALPLIGPLRASLLSNLEPVIAILAAMVILGERPAPAQFAGMAMVLYAIGLLYAADHRHPAD